MAEYEQLTFFHLLKGSAGGRALAERKGSEYFADLARNAAARRTREEKQAIKKKADAERRRRLHTIPRTIIYDDAGDLVTERIVPWWPHQKNRQRRQRPEFVRIELERIQLQAQTTKG